MRIVKICGPLAGMLLMAGCTTYGGVQSSYEPPPLLDSLIMQANDARADCTRGDKAACDRVPGLEQSKRDVALEIVRRNGATESLSDSLWNAPCPYCVKYKLHH